MKLMLGSDNRGRLGPRPLILELMISAYDARTSRGCHSTVQPAKDSQADQWVCLRRHCRCPKQMKCRGSSSPSVGLRIAVVSQAKQKRQLIEPGPTCSESSPSPSVGRGGGGR